MNRPTSCNHLDQNQRADGSWYCHSCGDELQPDLCPACGHGSDHIDRRDGCAECNAAQFPGPCYGADGRLRDYRPDLGVYIRMVDVSAAGHGSIAAHVTRS